MTHGPHDLIEHDVLYRFSKFGGRSSHAVGVVIFFVVHDGCLCVLVVWLSHLLSLTPHSGRQSIRG